MDSRTKLEDKLQSLRAEWLFSSAERRIEIEEKAEAIKEQLKGKMTSDEKIKAAQEKLKQWADEYREKQRGLYLNRNGATPEEIFK